ncbi:MAG TPA: alpha/beta fold hydrolase [Actinomycetota bacterium]|nr:alpha/beta fold hydrolase [Actinomycetota bacterium]
MATPATLLRSRSYRAASPFTVTTEDGIRLAGSRVGDHGPSVVFCHGLLGWHRKLRIVRFVEGLARRFVVYAIDLRGHGASAGASTYGADEILDVEAAVRRARAERPDHRLVSIGVSMGGVAVVRHAALRDGVDAVVVISSPARWDGHPSRAVARLRWMGSSGGGRRLARSLGVRLGRLDRWPEAPGEVVGRIAPTPLLVVHGRDDHFFDEEEAWRLYRNAGAPKRLMLASRFGHAEDGLSVRFAERLGDRILDSLDR